ncbi:MAG: type II and III secretion system protein [Acidobacteriaceae bacterium]
MQKDDPQSAEKDFSRAQKLDPYNRRYLLSADIAHQYVVTRLIKRAETEESAGRAHDAIATFEEAVRLDPKNSTVIEHLNALAANAFAVPPKIHTKSDEAAGPIELTPRNLRCTFHLNADERLLIPQVLSAYGVHPTVDSSVKSRIVRFDADDVDFAEAARMLGLTTGTFFAPLDPLHVIVTADTKENRDKYAQQAMETIYFPGLNAKELAVMGSIARNIFGVKQDQIEPNQGTMTVRAPDSELDSLNGTYAKLMMGRSELQLEVQLYEIDKTKMTNVGVVLPTTATIFNVPSEVNSILGNNSSLIQQLLAADPSLAGNYAGIVAALIASGALTGTVFNNPFAVFGGGLTETGVEWNGASANMQLNSSDVRSIDQVQLRVLDQEQATIRSGEQYPIMTSSYTLAAYGSSSSSETIPQIQYQDLGLTLKMQPHIDGPNEISLKLDLQVTSLGGSGIDNIPILNNRQYAGVVLLPAGDSALVVSAISRQDSLDITGVPGLNDIPGFQNGTNQQDTLDTMELAIVITPHIVRLAHQGAAGPMLLLPQH